MVTNSARKKVEMVLLGVLFRQISQGITIIIKSKI